MLLSHTKKFFAFAFVVLFSAVLASAKKQKLAKTTRSHIVFQDGSYITLTYSPENEGDLQKSALYSVHLEYVPFCDMLSFAGGKDTQDNNTQDATKSTKITDGKVFYVLDFFCPPPLEAQQSPQSLQDQDTEETLSKALLKQQQRQKDLCNDTTKNLYDMLNYCIKALQEATTHGKEAFDFICLPFPRQKSIFSQEQMSFVATATRKNALELKKYKHSLKQKMDALVVYNKDDSLWQQGDIPSPLPLQ